MDNQKVAQELLKVAKDLVAAPSGLPNAVKKWYDTFIKEGMPEKKALKEAIDRAFQNGDITEDKADKLEKKHKVAAEEEGGSRRQPFLALSKKIEVLRGKYPPTSDEAIYLGIVRDMAHKISRDQWSGVKRLALSIQDELEYVEVDGEPGG